MIKVVHNSAGSGDWVEVWDGDNIIFQDSSIKPNDLVDILNLLVKDKCAIKINVTDDQFQDMSWKELL